MRCHWKYLCVVCVCVCFECRRDVHNARANPMKTHTKCIAWTKRYHSRWATNNNVDEKPLHRPFTDNAAQTKRCLHFKMPNKRIFSRNEWSKIITMRLAIHVENPSLFTKHGLSGRIYVTTWTTHFHSFYQRNPMGSSNLGQASHKMHANKMNILKLAL